jgi:hypothetical protein
MREIPGGQRGEDENEDEDDSSSEGRVTVD